MARNAPVHVTMTPEQEAWVRGEAERRGVAVAVVVRDAIAAYSAAKPRHHDHPLCPFCVLERLVTREEVKS